MHLKKLTEMNGVSGDERAVRDYITDEISSFADDIRVDRLGNLIALRKGRKQGSKIMLSAHMDEVGFMVTGYGDNGTLKFKPVGSIDERILPGKNVVIGDVRMPGVIGVKPIHLQEKESRKENIKLNSLYIDIGADNKEEAEKLAPLGEYIAFHSEYEELGEHCVKSKALDDRVGCAILMDILKERFEFDLYTCFTVQEEIGLIGSKAAAYSVNPDLALVVEGTTCSDIPGAEEQDYSTRLGKGAALTIMDRTTYDDKGLVSYMYKLACDNNVSAQYKQTTSGGNDAGSIQRSRAGVVTASISVPCRYIHSPVSIMDKRDYKSCQSIVKLLLYDIENRNDILKVIRNGGAINA